MPRTTSLVTAATSSDGDSRVDSNSFQAAAEATRNRKQSENTQANYMSKVHVATRFLYSTYGNSVDLSEPLVEVAFAKSKDWTLIKIPASSGRRQTSTWVRLKLPLPKAAWDTLFGWLSTNTKLARDKKSKKKRKAAAGGDDEGDAAAVVPEEDNVDVDESGVCDVGAINKPTISVSTMQQYKSAIKWLHEHRRVRFQSLEESRQSSTGAVGLDETLETHLNGFINGYKKLIADKKKRGVMSVMEGKSVITDGGYIDLVQECRKLCHKHNATPSDFKAADFAWTWITMQWNLVSRSVSVQDIMLEHMDWHGDALVVQFAKSKGSYSCLYYVLY